MIEQQGHNAITGEDRYVINDTVTGIQWYAIAKSAPWSNGLRYADIHNEEWERLLSGVPFRDVDELDRSVVMSVRAWVLGRDAGAKATRYSMRASMAELLGFEMKKEVTT